MTKPELQLEAKLISDFRKLASAKKQEVADIVALMAKRFPNEHAPSTPHRSGLRLVVSRERNDGILGQRLSGSE